MRWTRRLAVAATLTVIGYDGLRVGLAFYPDSNLIGRITLLFPPIYWLGLACLIWFGVAWTTISATAAMRRRHS